VRRGKGEKSLQERRIRRKGAIKIPYFAIVKATEDWKGSDKSTKIE